MDDPGAIVETVVSEYFCNKRYLNVVCVATHGLKLLSCFLVFQGCWFQGKDKCDHCYNLWCECDVFIGYQHGYISTHIYPTCQLF